MRRAGILNADLAFQLARLGHSDLVVVADCGLPQPAGVPVVDLAVVLGVPTFEQVLRAVAAELVVEEAVVATESLVRNPAVGELVEALFGAPGFVDHTELKRLSGRAKLLVRTGEASPYANVVLRCGVPF